MPANSAHNIIALELAVQLIAKASAQLGAPNDLSDAAELALDVATGRLADATAKIRQVLESIRYADSDLSKMRSLPRS